MVLDELPQSAQQATSSSAPTAVVLAVVGHVPIPPTQMDRIRLRQKHWWGFSDRIQVGE